MSGLLIGYARASTDEQDLTAQRDGLAQLGVEPERIYVDHGLTGTTRAAGAPRSARGLPRRRHPRRDQARQARSLPSRRSRHRR